MHPTRSRIALFVGCTWIASAPASAQLVFRNGFEIDGACAWSPSGATDPCTSSRLYSHTGQALYRIDSSVPQVVPIGSFQIGAPTIVDIAIDRNDNMFGVSSEKLWRIDVSSGAATEIADFAGAADVLSSLAFLPVNPNDPAAGERLVTSGESGDVFEVSLADGSTTLLGNFGTSGGEQIHSAGDLLGIHGLGNFALVTVGAPLTDPDYVASLHPTTFAATLLPVSIGYDRVRGLGYWAGVFYGLADSTVAGNGFLLEIDPATGAGENLLDSALRWFGAAVSTDTPLPPESARVAGPPAKAGTASRWSSDGQPQR
jgi:hypothetical protein